MIQRFSIGLRPSVVYRLLGRFARPITAALTLAVAVIGLLVTAAATPLVPSLSTVIKSTWAQPPAAAIAPQGLNHDRGSRANQDDYLERLVEVLGHDS
jgi:hypothetical protein